MEAMIEIEPESKRGFAYGKDAIRILEQTKGLKYSKAHYELVGPTGVWSFYAEEYREADKQVDLLEMKDLRCQHGKPICFTDIHRLPQEGWEELIGCWSCHNDEFKPLLDLKPRPRKNGILVSNFYLLADVSALPECCKSEEKVFYNKITGGFTTRQLIFKFFEEQFEMKSTIVLKIADKKYEIKQFYRCVVIEAGSRNGITWNAFKVGFKETTKANDADGFIGEYFKNKILDQLISNSVDITVLGYVLSFISE